MDISKGISVSSIVRRSLNLQTSPMTNEPLQHLSLTPNYVIKVRDRRNSANKNLDHKLSIDFSSHSERLFAADLGYPFFSVIFVCRIA